MKLGDDLHQALGADHALGNGVVAGLDRDHRHHQQRVEADLAALGMGDAHEIQCQVLGHLVAFGQIFGQSDMAGIVRMHHCFILLRQHTGGNGAGLALHDGKS